MLYGREDLTGHIQHNSKISVYYKLGHQLEPELWQLVYSTADRQGIDNCWDKNYDTLFLVFPLVHHCLLYTQEGLVTEHLQYAGIYLVHV